jgi:hypothetical protein
VDAAALGFEDLDDRPSSSNVSPTAGTRPSARRM